MRPLCAECLLRPCNCLKPDNSQDDNDKNLRLHSKITPEKRCHHGSYSSPLRTINEEEISNNEELVSTPLRGSVFPSNPFDEVDSLHMSQFSPSVFAITTRDSAQSAPFRWSIEQLAVLEPADIDETSQQDTGIDAEKEVEAQKAIDAFFSNNSIVPSPWAPCTKQTSCLSHHALSATHYSNDSCKTGRKEERHRDNVLNAKDVSTQTMLTIPPNLDLMKLLGHFCTYTVESQNGSPDSSTSDIDVLSTSSLRRKLFMNMGDNDNYTTPPLRRNENYRNVNKHDTPVARKSPWVGTPASDHFSSSPITPRNFSLSLNYPRSPLSSPNISPIRASISGKSAASGHACESHKEQSSHEESAEDSLLEVVPDKQVSPQSAQLPQSIIMTSIYEGEDAVFSSTSDFYKHDNLAQPEVSAERDSNLKDTGYMTGSISYAGSMMTSQQSSVYMRSRTTPVIELMEDCAITKGQLVHEGDMNNSEVYYDADESLMATSQSDEASLPFKDTHSMSWHPSKFSTPTKNVLKFS